MNLHTKSVKGIGLLVAGMAFLAVPMFAQQEVDPDHFDATHHSSTQKPIVQQQKSAHAQTKSTKLSHVSRKAKSSSGPQATVKTGPTTIALDSNPR